MKKKEFKTIDEQLEILCSRGLAIQDKERAKDFLLENNYYRISGYSLTLRKNDKFSKTATFQNIIDIYEFDHELRHIILKYIEIIEVKMKSIYAYEFAKLHGGDGYTDKSFFTNENRYNEIIEKSKLIKKARLNNEPYLKHYSTEQEQTMPIWAYVDLLTISDISFLYSISDDSVKIAVANQFGMTFSAGGKVLGKFMHSMTIIRNICAHGNRLYNRLFEQKPSLNKEDSKLLIRNNDGSIDNAHFYGFVLIMRRLLSKDDFTKMKDAIIQLTEKYPFVGMKYYGFRDDWKAVL